MTRHDYSGAIAWQCEHDVPAIVTARLFAIEEASIPVIAWRERQGFLPKLVGEELNRTLQSGPAFDLTIAANEKFVSLSDPYKDDQQTASAAMLEEEIEVFAAAFWQNVKNASGVSQLKSLLRRVSRPSPDNIKLLRSSALLHHLISGLYLHSGYCRSALHYGHKALALEEQVFRATCSRTDLNWIGKTLLHYSHAFILRREFESAGPWLRRSRAAFLAAGLKIDPEYYRQLAVVQHSTGDIDGAVKNFKLAGDLLPDYKPNCTEAAVRDVGERHLHLIPGQIDWEKSFALMEFALEHWPECDIHRAMNVNAAASAGFLTDSPEAQRKSIELLDAQGHLSEGFTHQATKTKLLKMTPELPKPARADWVQFSHYYNSFRNK